MWKKNVKLLLTVEAHKTILVLRVETDERSERKSQHRGPEGETTMKTRRLLRKMASLNRKIQKTTDPARMVELARQFVQTHKVLRLSSSRR